MPKGTTVTTKTKLPAVRPPTTAKIAMKNRVVRVDDPTWEGAAARAEAEGINLSEVIRHYLREYAAGPR